MIALYHQIKIVISFLCSRELNLKFLIQPLETLLLELIGTHFREFQLIASTPNNNSLLLNQDINQFLV